MVKTSRLSWLGRDERISRRDIEASERQEVRSVVQLAFSPFATVVVDSSPPRSPPMASRNPIKSAGDPPRLMVADVSSSSLSSSLASVPPWSPQLQRSVERIRCQEEAFRYSLLALEASTRGDMWSSWLPEVLVSTSAAVAPSLDTSCFPMLSVSAAAEARTIEGAAPLQLRQGSNTFLPNASMVSYDADPGGDDVNDNLDSYYSPVLQAVVMRELILAPRVVPRDCMTNVGLSTSVLSTSSACASWTIECGGFVRGDALRLINGQRVWKPSDVAHWEHQLPFSGEDVHYITVLRSGRKMHVRVRRPEALQRTVQIDAM